MIDHTGIAVSDFDAAKAFYDKAFAPLGASLLMMVPSEHTGGVKVGGYGRDNKPSLLAAREHDTRTPYTSPSSPAAGPRSTPSTRRRSPPAARTMADRGCVPTTIPNYYGAFVFDPDGNNIEAVCHAPE